MGGVKINGRFHLSIEEEFFNPSLTEYICYLLSRLEVEGQEVLEYWVDHCSSDLDYESQLRETMVQNEVFARHNQLQQAEVLIHMI